MPRKKHQVDFSERERKKRVKLDKRKWERDINKIYLHDIKSKRQSKLPVNEEVE